MKFLKGRHPDREYIEQLPLSESAGNAYGTVISDDGLPVICGHGGSMYLCQDCAVNLLAGLPPIKKIHPTMGLPGAITTCVPSNPWVWKGWDKIND